MERKYPPSWNSCIFRVLGSCGDQYSFQLTLTVPTLQEDHLQEQQTRNQVTGCHMCHGSGNSLTDNPKKTLSSTPRYRTWSQTDWEHSGLPSFSLSCPPLFSLPQKDQTKKNSTGGGCEGVKKLNLYYHFEWSGGNVKIKGGVKLSIIYGKVGLAQSDVGCKCSSVSTSLPWSLTVQSLHSHSEACHFQWEKSSRPRSPGWGSHYIVRLCYTVMPYGTARGLNV